MIVISKRIKLRTRHKMKSTQESNECDSKWAQLINLIYQGNKFNKERGNRIS